MKYSISDPGFLAFYGVFGGKYACKRQAWIDWNLVYGRRVYATQHKPRKEIIGMKTIHDYKEGLTDWKAVSVQETIDAMVG